MTAGNARTVRAGVLASALVLSSSVRAEVDPACAGLTIPGDYNEQVQQDFQANFFALTSSFSPIHAAVPHEPGRGSIGVDVRVMPPLSCRRRFVLNWTKTEDTNKSPILPQISASYAFPALFDIVVPYAGVAFLPPIPVNGTRNFVMSAELGVGIMAHEFVDVGVRFHMALQRTYGDVATAFNPETDPVIEDVYSGSTWGIDAVVGFPLMVKEHRLSPFVAVGYLDASTFFFVGDTSHASNNLHPYNGSAFSVGLDTLLKNRLRLAGEFYVAPGGYSLPDATAEVVEKGSRYGNLATARFRIGYEF
jgi:hypothetical protein